MGVDFTKMHSLGNDFVMLDGVSADITLTPALARKLADRHFGIGCDQILVAEPGVNTDFRYRIFNQDGSEVEQCGNGARCFARFVRERGLTDKKEMSVETINARMLIRVEQNDDVTVTMGIPEFTPAKIPFSADAIAPSYSLDLGSEVGPKEIDIYALAIGNPHAVTMAADVDTAPVRQLGPIIETHSRFPNKVNAGFMQVVSPSHIRLRVFERGVGETLGCGSGACAAVAAGYANGLLSDTVTVSLPGGDATVRWQGYGEPIFLTGSAHTVFTGSFGG